jgi:chemotaxis protein CheY-P-specific phosphatase CheC
MVELNTLEQEKAQDLVRHGMKKAAESLSFFLKKTVGLKEIENDTCSLSHSLSLKTKYSDEICVLTTYLLGELKGVCYLIFSQQEMELLIQSELPLEILNQPELKKEMGSALLLEMDNIISANVITEFANALKVKIYGDVPSMECMPQNQLFDVLAQAIDEEMFLLSFKAHFINDELDFNPEFIWLFDQEFIQKIKSV